MAKINHVQSHPGGSDGKESACNTRDLGSIPGLGRSPRRGHGNPLQYSCLENPHEQRSLAGYRPWGHKESEMTEQLYFHFKVIKQMTKVGEISAGVLQKTKELPGFNFVFKKKINKRRMST